MTIVTNYSQFFSIFFLLYRTVSLDKDTSTDLFIESPGDGEEFVYSPVGVNATLHCAVNNTILAWFIDDALTFENPAQKLYLHSRGIYQSGPTPSTDGITVSSVTVYGDSENNNIRICCQSFVNELKENCTTVIIYDRPLPPTQVSVRTAGGVNLLNISWTATTMTGVNQTYIIMFDALIIKTTHPHHIFYQEITTADPMGNCGLFLAYVKAVNGAGESDPSNNVSIPSLPDIGPVTESLVHKVWKYDGEIRVNVSFQPAKFCLDYPVLRYLLQLLKAGQSRKTISVSLQLDLNETEVILGPEIGLEADQKYKYRVTAVNAIGNTTSHQDGIDLFTSDVQSVSATVVDESTIAIQCLFIHGSDALGCKVVLVSNCSNISDVYANLSKNNSVIMSASGKLSLAHKTSCYYRVFAFDIDINNTISNLTIEGMIKFIENELADGGRLYIPIVTIPSVLIPLILIMVVALSVALYKQRKYKKNSSVSKASCISRCLSGCACTKFLPTKSTDKDTQQTPTIHAENDENYCSRNNVEENECANVTQTPLYCDSDTPQVVYEEPYDCAVSRLPQIEPVLEQCPAYGVLTK